jgi:quinol-cytochrome oxidoreductase complex cytochrome b subunit
MRPNFFHHLHPPTISAEQSRWRYTLGAGGLAVFLALILGFTGILEMFFYAPDPQQAALSIQILSYHVPFGGLIRNLHYWAAQLLVLVSGVHLVRVIFTGAYAPPRRFNYLLGLGLFVTLVLDDFTGYILRWDQDICWALVTGTNLLKTIPGIGTFLFRIAVGGQNACETALLRFYTWHIFGLILLSTVLIVWHLFRVRRDGGIAVPPPELRPNRERITRFELVRREVLAMLLASAVLILLATFFPAPIATAITGQPAISEEARAPWFFLWVQQMLKWGDPFFWGVLMPLIFLLLLALIPYIFSPPAQAELGRWFPPSARSAQITAGILFLVILLLTLRGLTS